MAEVRGDAAPRFRAVLDAFAENFDARDEVGASLCVWHEGEKVVDLWGGVADPETGRPWEADTLGLVFSVTKGLSATALLMLADRGLLDHDVPVAHYWPGFAAAGKGDVRVRTLLNHRAGVCAIDAPLTLDDLEDPVHRVVPALEAQRPLWEPDTAQGYHGVSFGPYAAELFRRVAGKTLGTFLREEVAGPLGADVHLGLPASEEPRVARVIPSSTWTRLTRALPAGLLGYGVEGRILRAAVRPKTLTARAFANPKALGATGLSNFNTARVHRMELPWANGIVSARGLARVYAALAHGGSLDGVRLVSPEIVSEVMRRQSWGMDRVLRKTMGFSLGFVKEEPHLFSPYREAFGHPGMGGSLGLADPPRHLAIGYVCNHMSWKLRSPRALALAHAIYRCVA